MIKKTIALVGNPNCGKSTLFNSLTGSNQYVGNWPGVTVEKKLGKIKRTEHELTLVDLPGIYSLSTSTLEEVITREFAESHEVDLIVNVVDAANLERNLFLTLQLMEIGKPMIVVLNMIDVLKSRGDVLDIAKISTKLGVSVLDVVASKSEGLEALVTAMEADHAPAQFIELYSPKTLKLIKTIRQSLKISISPNLHAIRFIEEGMVAALDHGKDAVDLSALNQVVEDHLRGNPLDRDMIISDEKYRFITDLTREVLVRKAGELPTLSERIDAVLTHRLLAFPIFLLIMWGVFS